MRRLKKTYDWVRFWIDPQSDPHLSAGAFLIDPRRWSQINADARTLSEVGERACVVLLGEQGVGKTSDVKRYIASVGKSGGQPGVIARYVHLGNYGSEESLRRDVLEDPDFVAWKEGSGVYELFLDSLEEAPVQAAIDKYVVRELSRTDRARLRVRIVCRTAVWPASLEERLRSIWQEDAPLILRMAPLRLEDVDLALKNDLSDSERTQFFEELSRVSAESFAARPVTLRFLIRIFLDKGQLPPSQIELYREGCTLLCREVDQDRVDAGHAELLTPGERLTVAGRLALLTQLSGAAALSTDPDPADASTNDMSIDAVIRGYGEFNDVPKPIGRQHLLEVLSSGLFTPAGPNRVAWGHRSFAEYLAASYLQRREVPMTQAVALLGHAADPRRVAPQLAGVATWLASLSQEAWRIVAKGNPDLVLASDSPTLSDTDKSELVEALIDLSSKGFFGRYWDRSSLYKHLCHPGLSAQLRPRLDRSAEALSRKEAIALGKECHLEDLAPVFCDIALDDTETPATRREAIFAVGAIDEVAECSRLVTLAMSAAHDKSELEVKAALLSVLWPKHLSTEELCDSIAGDKPETNVGEYDLFLSHTIPDRMEAAELAKAYDWIAALPEMASLSLSHRDLVDALLCKGRTLLYTLEGRKLLARTVVARLQHDGFLHGRNGTAEFVSEVTRDSEERRAFLESLIEVVLTASGRPEHSDENDVDWRAEPLYYSIGEFVEKADFGWLIAKYDAATISAERRILVHLARTAFDPDDPTSLQVALERQADELLQSALRGVFEAKESRAKFSRETPHRDEQASKDATLRARMEKIPEIVQRILGGEITAWPELTWAMGNGMPDTLISTDVVSLPAWKGMSEDLKRQIVHAAEQFAEYGDIAAQNWLGSNQLPFELTTAYAGLKLVTQENRHFFETLPSQVWKRWAPLLVGYWMAIDDGSEDGLWLRSQAFERAPAEAASTFRILIEAHERAMSLNLVLTRFRAIPSQHIADTLVEKLLSNTCSAANVGVYLSDLFHRVPSKASEISRDLLGARSSAQSIAVAAAVSYIEQNGADIWRMVWKDAQNEPAFLRRVVAAIAYREIRSFLQNLVSDEIAELFEWMLDQFPAKRYRPSDSGGQIGLRRSIAMFRDTLPTQLAYRGDQESCVALERLRERHPEYVGLSTLIGIARNRLLEQTWEPIAPDDLLKICADKERRHIRNESQLLDVLLESLRRLDNELQGTPPAAQFLWNKNVPKEEEALSDYIDLYFKKDIRDRGIVVNREVQFRRKLGGEPGEVPDILVQATTRDQETGIIFQIAIEVKGCWHDKVRVAMEETLVLRYLAHPDQKTGLYVVGWYHCPAWDDQDYKKADCKKQGSREEATAFFSQQADQLSTSDKLVRSFVLDATIK